MELCTPLIVLTAIGAFLSAIMQGCNIFSAISYASVVRGVVGILAAILLTSWAGAKGAAISVVLASASFAIILFILFLSKVNRSVASSSKPDESFNLQEVYKMVVPLVLLSLFQTVADWGSQALLANGGGRWAEVADLGVARQISFILPILSSSMATAALPTISSLQGNLGYRSTVTGYLKMVWLVQLPIAAVTIAVVPTLLSVFYGPKMISAVPTCRLLICSYTVFGLVWTAGPILTGTGRTWRLFLLHAIRSTFILGLSWQLLPILGICGIGISYLIGECCIGLLIAVLHHRSIIPILWDMRFIFLWTSPVIFGAACAVFLQVYLAVSSVLFGVITSAILIWTQTNDTEGRYIKDRSTALLHNFISTLAFR
jgi:O-antigen/teichoic acid export membrane protein